MTLDKLFVLLEVPVAHPEPIGNIWHICSRVQWLRRWPSLEIQTPGLRPQLYHLVAALFFAYFSSFMNVR